MPQSGRGLGSHYQIIWLLALGRSATEVAPRVLTLRVFHRFEARRGSLPYLFS